MPKPPRYLTQLEHKLLALGDDAGATWLPCVPRTDQTNRMAACRLAKRGGRRSRCRTVKSERNTKRSVTNVQRWLQHAVHPYLAATLEGFVTPNAIFEVQFMLRLWLGSEEAAAERP
jgi:hypothetical protein